MRLVPLPSPSHDEHPYSSSDSVDSFDLVALVVRSTLSSTRHRLHDQLTAHGLDPDDACLVLSELVGNALLHGGESAAVAWRLHGDRLHIGVADGAALGLTVLQEHCQRDGGRGLFLVDLLAESWGVRPLGTVGKEIWCQLQVKAA
ncbi:ATP-binding protein [Kitasatospora acidiphila]|uniref:ATP-binding protein n=1 Tax=Kitasatospora acidiphila TaxID=2567942 RepID=A0A540W602_9ACTN|nr:ATP-binding protein [Kitasatospora acidiphila]TQF04452.1 ATP-binding protein [Kitasatospora acidiphila]